MGKHYKVEKPVHDQPVKETITVLKSLEFDSRNMSLGIEDLLLIQNQMLQHVWYLTETETSYLRSWEFAEAERKACYSETFILEKPGKTDALAKEATSLLIKEAIYNEIHAKWKFKSVKRVCEVANDTIYAIKDRLKSAKREIVNAGTQT